MGTARNRYYFHPRRPVSGIVLLLWGAFVLVVGIDTREIFSLFWGGILLLIGAALLVAFFRSRISGWELDEYRKRCADTALPEALAFFALDEGSRPSAFAEGYFFHQMPGQLPMARYGKDGVPRTDIGAAQLFFLQRGRVYCYQKQFSLITEDGHVETLVLALSDIDEIRGEAAQIPCKTPREEIVQVSAERMSIRALDGDSMELQLSSGAVAAADALRRAVDEGRIGGGAP